MSTLFPEIIEAPKANSRGITPRDYQQRGIDETFRLFEAGAEGVLCASHTGSGKTLLGSLIAERWINQGVDNWVMICAHERQLVTQFAEEVEAFTGIVPGIEMADLNVKFNRYSPKIIVCSRQTLMENKEGNSRLFKFWNTLNWLLICDEVHRWKFGLKTCKHIMEWFGSNPNSRRLGLTATPERGDGTTLSRVCPAVGLDFPLYDLNGGQCGVDQGWAVPYDQRFVTVHGIEWKNVREVAGDFNADDLEQLLIEHETIMKLLEPTLRLVGNRRTIIFNPGVQMAKAIAHTINALRADWKYDFPCPGEAKSLDGSVPDVVRNSVYKQHQNGEFQFLSVCGLCREGYNDPGIQAVAVFRPTKSRGLAEQMKGRGCRPLRGTVDGLETAEERRAAIAASDKPTCMIIDLVGITGMPPVVSTADLLAGGFPDEVIELANKNAQEHDDSEPIDMVEELRKAQQQIADEKEREAARLAREAQEREERMEAARRARLEAAVKFDARQVQVGEMGGSHTKNDYMGDRMPWGKHKGKKMSDVPGGYLRAIQHNTAGSARKNDRRTHAFVTAELNRRERAGKPNPDGPCTEAQARVLKMHAYRTDVTYAKAADFIREINQLLGTH